MARLISSTVGPRSGDPGGERGCCTVEGVGGVIDAWGKLPQMSVVAVGSSLRVRPGVAVRRKARHDALGFPSPARRIFTVAWLPRLGRNSCWWRNRSELGGSEYESRGLARLLSRTIPEHAGRCTFVVHYGTGQGYCSQCGAKEGRASLTLSPGPIIGRPSISQRPSKRRMS